MFFFFFSSRRRHTRFKCDWSSDVCSSDLRLQQSRPRPAPVESMSARVQPHHSGGQTRMKSSREQFASANAAILGRRDVLGHSFEENLCHHSLVFVIEKMAMKDGHAPDYGIGEIHDDVDGTAVRNIHGV